MGSFTKRPPPKPEPPRAEIHSTPKAPEKPAGWVGPAPQKRGAFQQVNALHALVALIVLCGVISAALWVAQPRPGMSDGELAYYQCREALRREGRPENTEIFKTAVAICMANKKK